MSSGRLPVDAVLVSLLPSIALPIQGHTGCVPLFSWCRRDCPYEWRSNFHDYRGITGIDSHLGFHKHGIRTLLILLWA